MEPRLLLLPPELQTALISWLFRLDDLARVCLVSKQLQQVALPLLYRDVSVNVSDWAEAALQQFTTRGHPGHRHIRSIDVDSADLESEPEALKAAKDVLQILPRNGLRSFRCPLECGIDNDLVVLLAGSQRNLRSICIGPLLENAWNLIDALKPWPPTIVSLILPWSVLSPTDFVFYHDIIERSRRQLQALTVRVQNFPWLPNAHVSIRGSEELARGMFGHKKGSRYHRTQLEIRDLNFQNQDLATCDSTWSQYIDLTKLHTLQIWNCEGTDQMLRCLINLSKSKPLQLEGLVLSFEQPLWSPLLAQELLRSISGLHYLNLCYKMPVETEASHPPFDVRCLANHVHTLEDLYLGIGTNDPEPHVVKFWPGRTGDAHWLAQHCGTLKQVAVAMPELTMEDALAGSWESYMESLIELAKLPRLKVLRLLVWPVECSHRRYKFTFYDPRWREHRAEYLEKLDVLADAIARLFVRERGEHHDRLSVITFGNAERRDFAPTRNLGRRMRIKKPVTYKIRQVESEFGMLLETVRMDPAEMQYEEPIAFVFDEDTDQGLSLESYPWGDS